MELTYKPKNGWESNPDQQRIFDFCHPYKLFLDQGKTERECAKTAIAMAEQAGFVPLSAKSSLQPGDKVYVNNRGKSVLLAVVGAEPMAHGLRIVASHIDSPRLDLKQNPMYESLELALFKTHYYGGIKKYQWTAIPLALHGVITKGDGSLVEVHLGEDASDPTFCVTDLLPHLAQEQMNKPMKDAITGEGLNILIGSKPGEGEKDKVKLQILALLNERYGICEEDFISAELEAVPAGRARDVGFDRSLVGAYGQDDRVCSYAGLMGILETTSPARTAVCLLADKEEVGSMGATGMMSRFFEDTVAKLLSLTVPTYNDLLLRECLGNSQCLSADVGAAMDPTYKDVQESNNAPHLNYGVMLTKYTGSRGKSGSSDADAEFVGIIRKLCNDNGIAWQIGELGKVDQGGGGTVAQYLANLNINTLDCGVPLLSMHSPFEIASKLDIYMTYRLYHTFYQSN